MTLYYTHKFKEINAGSHELLELAIADFTGDRNKASKLISSLKRDTTRDFEGKPYINGFDKFSISHSDGSWAVLIDKRECGLDIQYEKSCNFLQIAERFFNPEDAALVRGMTSENTGSEIDARSEFFRIWTRREALIKALGLSVATDDLPPVGRYNSAEYEGCRYYIGSIDIPDSPLMHASICLDASEDIDDRLIYKEMYVK